MEIIGLLRREDNKVSVNIKKWLFFEKIIEIIFLYYRYMGNRNDESTRREFFSKKANINWLERLSRLQIPVTRLIIRLCTESGRIPSWGESKGGTGPRSLFSNWKNWSQRLRRHIIRMSSRGRIWRWRLTSPRPGFRLVRIETRNSGYREIESWQFFFIWRNVFKLGQKGIKFL